MKGLQGLFVGGARGRVVSLRFRDVRQIAQSQDNGLAPPYLPPQRHSLFGERPRFCGAPQPQKVDAPAVQERGDAGLVAKLAIDLQTLFGKAQTGGVITLGVCQHSRREQSTRAKSSWRLRA